jgi:hypothetical protein
MKPVTIAKIAVDCAMTLLLFFLMAFHVTGESAHIISGSVMCALVITHLVLNRNWLQAIHKGRYTAVRIFQLVCNIQLFLTMIGLVISGIMMTPIRQYINLFSLDTARTIHLVLAYWAFVLISFHVGIYVKKMMATLRIKTTVNQNRRYVKPMLLTLAILIFGYGIYAFVNREIHLYMFLIHQYSFFDYEQPVYRFFIDYLAIMGAFIIVAHYSSTLFSKNLRSAG